MHIDDVRFPGILAQPSRGASIWLRELSQFFVKVSALANHLDLDAIGVRSVTYPSRNFGGKLESRLKQVRDGGDLPLTEGARLPTLVKFFQGTLSG